MKEDPRHTTPFDLLSRYLSGNASDSEVNRLEEWVAASAENKSQFRAYKKAWILSGMKENYQNIEVDKEWEALSEQLSPGAKLRSLPKNIRPRRFFFLRIAAAVALLVLVAAGLYRSWNAGESLEVLARNEVREQQLPDGTQIALNQNSSLQYSSDSKKAKRRVALSGDAFFEVKKDNKRPFVIQAQTVEVKVLGTSFYVDSREEQSTIQVIVQSGLVAMSTGDQTIELRADESGIYHKNTGQLVKKQNEDANYLAWKNDELVFKETDLETVLTTLNRHFDAQLSLAHEGLRSCKLTATFKDQSLEAIVKILELTFDLQTERQGEQIVFSGKGCD